MFTIKTMYEAVINPPDPVLCFLTDNGFLSLLVQVGGLFAAPAA